MVAMGPFSTEWFGSRWSDGSLRPKPLIQTIVLPMKSIQAAQVLSKILATSAIGVDEASEGGYAMLEQIAETLTHNIDEITRRWVEALRQSPRTEGGEM